MGAQATNLPSSGAQKLSNTAAPAPAAATPAAGGKEKPDLFPAVKSEIQITSDSMDMNLQNHTTAFVGHVEVTDSRMRLKADRMVVLFGEDNKPQSIEATGNVSIIQPEVRRRAKSGKAQYDVVKGIAVLTENPVLTERKSAMSGAEKIIYSRDDQTMKTEGGHPVITIVPEDDAAFNDLNILSPSRKKDGN